MRVITILTLLGVALTVQAQDNTESNAIVARVNKIFITLDEVKKEAAPLARQMRLEYSDDKIFHEHLVQLLKDTLNNKINRILIVESFRKIGGTLQKSAVEAQYEEFIQSNFNGDRKLFNQYLREEGKTKRQMMQDIEEREIVAYMRERETRSQTSISPELIESYYNQNKAAFVREPMVRMRQIMLEGNLADEKVKQALTNIQEELKTKNFAEVAKIHGGDAGKLEDLPWLNQQQLRTELADVAFKLADKTCSQPVPVNNYVFLLYVEEHQIGSVRPLNDVRPIIEKLLSEQITQEHHRKWLDQLRRNAYVEVKDFHID